MTHRTLVLNGNYQPLVVISVTRALQLVFAQKAEVIEESNTYFHSQHLAIAGPLVIRIFKVRKVPFRRRLPVTRRAVLSRDNYVCGYCGGKADTIDHVVPKAQGGKHMWRNVAAACRSCNGKKRDRTPAEAGMKLRIKPFEPEGEIAFLVVFGKMDESWQQYLTAVA